MLLFIFGAVVAGVGIGPSEYQRGHASGYVAGRDDATEIGNKTLQKMMSIMEKQRLAESR